MFHKHKHALANARWLRRTSYCDLYDTILDGVCLKCGHLATVKVKTKLSDDHVIALAQGLKWKVYQSITLS